ncbi:response regulator [Desulfuromonas carbonis]|uniref:ATP-binding protein n=1 Tax=Desulfuromonas sp. DDH964 TaxID=1823759 RepID=UPI00078E5B26|nr:ATP-binding protein [Desulfuromonas sp. DDH964]AMV71985.1 response receiver histidine kinase [Desulfuromonas sp. DDH964]
MGLEGKMILLIENDPEHIRQIREAFAAAAAEAALEVVATPAQARAKIGQERPDLVIIDLLPQAAADGIELLQSATGTVEFPVIILARTGDEKSAVAAIKAGALDFLVRNEVNIRALPQIVEGRLREWKQLQLTREAEAELRQSKARYKRLYQQFQALLDGIPDILILFDANLKIGWINRAGMERFGIGALEDGTSPCCFEDFHGNREPCSDCPVQASFTSGKAEESLVTTPGGRIWGIKAFPLKGPDGEIQNVIELASEVTEKIKLRAEGVRASQLATLGELAAGVAHEINNPVNSIINFGQLLLDRHHDVDRDYEVAREIIDDGMRIARMVRSLLSFAQNRGEARRALRLDEIIAFCLDLSNSQLRKEGISVELDLPTDLPAVVVENQPIQQVVLNLISNARYALNEKYPPNHPGKRLSFRGRRLAGEDGARVRLEVTDFGTGIPAQVLGRVMDHYFTTKPPDRGNGLGLSMSREMVAKQGGELRIASIEGESTTVTLDLPAAEEEIV